ncbi:MAG: PaaI family thioesterase [Desulfomonile tiedjei]|uniref:PaaI family thioesterase n=1 Tax=Desulfomonile tiedjei TaxID=2358 RepID=A0A9D6Z248_9BACT|nr:PaaI family thioesterase [Desulfomonile tiedjei]
MYRDLQLLVRGEVQPPVIDKLMGFSWTAAEPGKVVMEMETDEKHANAMGTLHGGVLCSMADACMGSAFASTLNEGESFALLELKINFLKPVWRAKLTATATVVKRGDTIGLVECEIRDEGQSLVAKAAGTCMVLRNEKADGRRSVLVTR